jgi:iron complex outermembrane receptor protein
MAGSLALSLLCVGGLPAAAGAEEPAADAVAQAPPGDQPPRPAQPGARPRGLEAITVTARKVEENLQTTPVAVTAFSGADLEGASVVEVKDLGRLTPNMRFENTAGTGSTATISIRGISQQDLLITGDPSVGVYIDDVYNARVIGANFNLLDVESIEVLKGPQGTLYGRNTPAGAVKITSRKPDGTFGGWAKGLFGDDNRTDAEGAIQFPILGEALSARFAFQSQNADGWVENDGDKVLPSLGTFPAVTDKARETRSQGARGTLRWAPTESLEILTRGYYFRSRGQQPNPHILRAVDPRFMASATANPARVDQNLWNQLARAASRNQTYLNNDGREDVDARGGNVEINYDLAGIDIKFISGHRDYLQRYHTDSDATPFILFHNGEPWDPVREKSRQHSDELTVSGLLLNEALQYTTGLYYFEERSSTESSSYFGNIDSPPFPAPVIKLLSRSNLVSKVRAWGAYAQSSYSLTDRLRFNAGIRTTYERRRMDRKFDTRFYEATLGFLNGLVISSGALNNLHDRWSAVTWLAGLDYQFTDDIFGYAKASTGYRSGGFNGRAGNFPSAIPFGEEKVLTYELGAKTEFFDSRVRANLAGYFTKYRDIQTTSLVACSTGICTVIVNTGRVDLSGLELDVQTRLIEGLDVNFGVGWTVFRYTSGPRSGGLQRIGDLSGDGIPDVEQTSRATPANVPALTYMISAKYTLPEFSFGILSGQLDWYYQSQIEGSGDNGRAEINPFTGQETAFRFTDFVQQNAFGTLNGRIALELPRFNTELALFGRNLLDREYFVSGVDWAGSAGFGYWTRNYGPERKWGFEVTYRFGSEAGS